MTEGQRGGRIKGAAVREFVIWYGERIGAPEVASRVLAIPAERRGPIDPYSRSLGLLASSWYPAETVHALLDVLTGGLSPEERHELAMEASAAVMTATLRGVYRLLFRAMATPSRYAAHAGRLWTAYYDSGVFRVEMASPTEARSSIATWTAHHPFICLLNWGAATQIYRAMGCADVHTDRLSCVDEGAATCSFVTRWT